MRSIPYGYRIENGKAVLEPIESDRVRLIFDTYLKTGSLVEVRKASGLDKTHSSFSRILEDPRYRGTDYYPEIIDAKVFEAVQKKRKEVKRKRSKRQAIPVIPGTRFLLRTMEESEFPEDPSEKAAYIYEKIEVRE